MKMPPIYETKNGRSRARLTRLPVCRIFVLLLLTALFSGCAPVVATSRINDAQVAVERARSSRADQFAPYEYYKARFFLYKAREEWGHSDFSIAMDLADEAKKQAEIAVIKAKEDPWQGSPADPKRTPESMSDDGRTNNMLGVER